MSAKPDCALCAKPIRREADGQKIPADFYGDRVLPPRAKQVAGEHLLLNESKPIVLTFYDVGSRYRVYSLHGPAL